MFINIFFYLIKAFCKIVGLSFSFSNDGEDFALIKYLAKIKKGTYIDIGSHHPIKISNTFIFYLMGWRGVCIDPIPSLKKKYKLLRKDDLFINAGVIEIGSNEEKKLNFHYYKDHPDNSTFDLKRVQDLKDNFDRNPSYILPVPTITVKEIISSFNEYFKVPKEIYLLNLDIEGFEINILNDFFSNSVYPWVICVEEIGQIDETLKYGDLYLLMKKNEYLLGCRTFHSSIYIRKNIISKLPSPYIKELNI